MPLAPISDRSAPPAPPTAESYGEAALLARLDMMIKTNLDLVSHRMGWLLISQSFLFTAFALAAAHVTSPQADRASLYVFVHVVPILGIATTAFVCLSLWAVLRVIWRLKHTRSGIEARLIRPLEEIYGASSVPNTSPLDWIGHLPAMVVPPLFACAWLYLLLS